METFVGYLNYVVFFAIQGGIFAILCLGLNIQWGYTGLFNIGIAGFYAVGAYTSALLSGPPPTPLDWRIVGGYQLPFVVGLLGAMGVSGILAFLIGIPTLRLKEDYLAIATIGIAEVIRLVLKNEAWLTNSVWGLKNLPSPLQGPIERGISAFLASHPDFPRWLTVLVSRGYNWFYLAVVMVLIFLLYKASERIIRSPWGRVLRAIREDEAVAAVSGKDVFWFKMQSLILGSMLMGLAGGLYAHFAKFIDAMTFEPMFGTFIIWVMLIAGGSGNSKGAILGSFTIWAVWAGTDFVTGHIHMVGYREGALRVILIGLLLEIILIMRPQGILGEEKMVSKMYEEEAVPEKKKP
ncbi:MAG: branched-chain amino acid ABC transporter permease [Deltaproteobacteria bacterium]|nr:branched-chain amino acid ABC transporter permease [Deltaproteobacteria bacterium]MBW2120262.1 branched-chain amino acid ABC transporter permease [Deltaproteobacteria bacterium]